jgi:hypothetical protein
VVELDLLPDLPRAPVPAAQKPLTRPVLVFDDVYGLGQLAGSVMLRRPKPVELSDFSGAHAVARLRAARGGAARTSVLVQVFFLAPFEMAFVVGSHDAIDARGPGRSGAADWPAQPAPDGSTIAATAAMSRILGESIRGSLLLEQGRDIAAVIARQIGPRGWLLNSAEFWTKLRSLARFYARRFRTRVQSVSKKQTESSPVVVGFRSPDQKYMRCLFIWDRTIGDIKLSWEYRGNAQNRFAVTKKNGR